MLGDLLLSTGRNLISIVAPYEWPPKSEWPLVRPKNGAQ